ncbi:ABC transporter substrate-binding protein [Phytomonospora sp. NPDC050363]|uniref:ABC transporter substrate-binding protein n=1 Tax=Phytomonospora sp. NPDC050363 TaxID=3155642 RepID=UPI0033FCEBDA
MRRSSRIAAAGGLVIALALSACSQNTGEGDGASDDIEVGSLDIIGTEADSTGPATPVPNAKPGGTIDYTGLSDFVHLDPSRTYVGSYMMVGNGLLWRTLNGYREEPGGGLKLVGDLATNPGLDVNGDCKVWEYTLKTGLKYEDGTEITAADVAYGIARSFTPELGEGAQFLQNWLQESREYKGPYEGAEKVPPGVTVNGNKITFTFDKARCELPFAVAMPNTAPVPEAKDTKGEFDKKPFSSGPYKIESRTIDEEMVLVRNEHWDEKTDPIRHAYPDKFEFKFGAEPQDTSVRLDANAGGDENLFTFAQVYPDLLPQVTSDLGKYGTRVVQGAQKYNGYIAINNNRVKDLATRQALNYAFPRDRWVQLQGGEFAAKPGTAFMTPSVPGFKEFNAYPADIEKAKELLAGKSVKLRYAYQNASELDGQIASMFKDEYAKIGVELETVPLEPTGWYDQIGDPTNEYDLYWAGWGADWPSGSTVIPPCLGEDGISDVPGASTNYSYFTEPTIEAEIDRLESLPVTEALPGWGELDEKIMKEFAPYIPADISYGVWMSGSNIGGLQLGQNLSTLDITKLFLIDPALNA